ncbi:hypothetical protein G9A89_013409 [Geosiphon pyriformis]|nr:hypothetical protein G9A89_013409 [Geosiphon pyriformis]
MAGVQKQFLVAKNTAVLGNVCHFVRDMFRFICYACWEAGPDFDVVSENLIKCVNWVATVKAIHRQLLVAVQKRLYDKKYPGMLCLMYREVEFSDYIFTCVGNIGICNNILAKAFARWSALVGAHLSSSSAILQVLLQCFSDLGLYTVVYKRFVLGE